MPEGDTIFRAAQQLRRALTGRPLTRFELIPPHRGGRRLNIGPGLSPKALLGRAVLDVEARGKNLLVHFEDDVVLYTHLKMSGSWRIYRQGEKWAKPREAASVRIDNAAFVAVGFSVPIVELMTQARLRRHPTLTKLGPDLLAQKPDFDEMLRRLSSRPELPLGEALLDQRVLAGLGNVYKSELCFLLELNPFRAVGEIERATLRRGLEMAAGLMRENLGPHRRITRRGGGGPHWVYGRSGEPCGRCASRVKMRRQGGQGRSTYFCPRCQSISAPS